MHAVSSVDSAHFALCAESYLTAAAISAISDGKAVRVDLSLTMSEPGLSDPGVPTQYDSPSP